MATTDHRVVADSDQIDFTKVDDFSDVILVVEGQRLHTCKAILASASPVFRRMFLSEFKEKGAQEIPLTGKAFDDVVELLHCVTPAVQKPISNQNIHQMLPLSDEYQMKKLKQDCEDNLLTQIEAVPSMEQNMRYLLLAQKYHLETLLDKIVNLVAELPAEELKQYAEYQDIEQDILLRILTRRVHLLEKDTSKLQQSTESWRRKCEETEDCLSKMSREKLTVKRSLDDIDAAWELKGSDARCIDPVHIYGPRNYNCEKCSRQVCTYIQSKVLFLLNRGSTHSGISWPQ